MKAIEPNLTGTQALHLVQKLKHNIRLKEDRRLFTRSEFVAIDRVELFEFFQALEKLEERLKWCV